VNTSILAEELAPLEAQIEHVRQRQESLEDALRVVEAELETFSADRQRFDALRDVCRALDTLGALEADNLFWEGIPEPGDAAGHVERLRSRITRFEEEISSILEKQQSLRDQIHKGREELNILYEEVRDAYDREERRKEEYVIEREISSVPYRKMVMPWTKDAESEKRFQRAVLVALLICLVLGAPVPLIKVPIPDRAVSVVEIPERLVKLVKKTPENDMPVRKSLPKPLPEEPKVDPELAKTEPEKKKDEIKPSPHSRKG